MVSPAKKRKLNGNDSKPAVRGIEYFFAKQKKPPAVAAKHLNESLSDEELARKLQAEWSKEEAGSAKPDDAAPGPPVQQPAALPTRTALGNSGNLVASGTSTAPSKDEDQDATATPAAAASKPARNFMSLQSVATAEDTVSSSLPLDESPLTFQPSKYIDKLKEQWSADGGNASYALLTRCFVLVGGTSSRIKIVDTLVNCIRILIEADPTSLLPAVRWSACLLHKISLHR